MQQAAEKISLQESTIKKVLLLLLESHFKNRESENKNAVA